MEKHSHMTTRSKLAGLVSLIPALMLGISLLGGTATVLRAAEPSELHINLEPPAQRAFVLDKAGLLKPEAVEQIRKLGDKLLTDKAAPIVVVTINSMAEHGPADLRIETFARLLFDQWQIGPAKVGETNWNHGILLLVSKNDRKARIELGAGWRHDKDQQAQQIMDTLIIPHFKQGDFSGGIVAGVEALDKMARDLKLPQPAKQPASKGGMIMMLVLVGLAIFTAVSLIRRGSSGWAWLAWGAVFGIIGAVLYSLMSNNSGSSGSYGGGGFSGGSFGGGGFSGGGGASGSW
jgi:uncharacterized protein